jgi:hypothetical protein
MDFFHVYWQPPRTPSTPRKRRLPSSPPPQRHNQRDHQQQRQPHDTALRPRRPSAPQSAARGMFPKQMPLCQHPAVRSAVEIRLPPVPRRMEATAHHSDPVYQRLRQKIAPATTTVANPTRDSPRLVRCRNPKSSASRINPHQKPSPRVIVNCAYPRSIDSSVNPTQMNTKPHNAA